MCQRVAVIVVVLFTGCLSASEPAGDWLQWRGPQRDGQVAGPAWPAKLDEKHLKQLWRIELGPSYSGPIVAGGLVFTTETKDRKFEVVRALDRSNGKEIWKTQWEGAMAVPFFASANGSWIRSTPACDGESLFVAGMRDVLLSLDARSGKERWRIDFMKEMKSPLPSFGCVCSPLVDGDAVYIQAGAAFVKLDKNTGKVLWRTLVDEGGMGGSAFSSPIMLTFAGVRQVVVQTRQKLAGIQLSDGAVLWSVDVPAFRGMNILTPVPVGGDSIFTTAYGGKSLLFQIHKTEDRWTVKEVWSKALEGYMSTPVVVADYAYLLLRNQKLTCLDLRTGQATWTTTEKFGQYWSLLAQKDRILALDEQGTLYLFRANPEKLEMLDSRKISEQDAWAHIAVAGRHIFVRELNALACYEFE